MEQFESDSEVLEFAIAREVSAYQFYMDLVEQMENEALRALFERLAKDELRHKANLELEMMKVGKVVATQTQGADLEDTAVMIVVQPGADVDLKNALMLAIQKEKKSFRIYVDLSAMVRDEQSRETLLSLAEEEARHKVLLELEYEMVAKGR
jgi:rubrerythrin